MQRSLLAGWQVLATAFSSAAFSGAAFCDAAFSSAKHPLHRTTQAARPPAPVPWPNLRALSGANALLLTLQAALPLSVPALAPLRSPDLQA
jgi:hypothetical protein